MRHGNRPRRWHAGAVLAAGVALLGMAAPVRAQWPHGTTVLDTFHNLTHPAAIAPMSGMIANYRQACVYCHAPHGSGGERPLWNRRLPTGPYRMFSPLLMLADPQPTGVSRNCLSCHDGTIGLDDVQAQPLGFAGTGPFRVTLERCATSCHQGGNPAGGFDFEKKLFRPDDLRNQHPISVIYDPSRDPDFLPASSVTAAGLVLEDGRVQCATCHEPHTERFPPFLRLPNTNGSLCLTCHRTPPARSTAHFW